MSDLATDLGAIERRMAATRQLRQLAQAISALARAQLPLTEHTTALATEYFDEVDALFEELAGPAVVSNTTEFLRVVVGPERPFCGSLAEQLVEELPHHGMLGIVGQRLSRAIGRDPGLAQRVLFQLPGAVNADEAENVAESIAEAVLQAADGKVVDLWHPTHGGTRLHRSTLLASRRRPSGANLPETFSPLFAVVEAAVRESITGRLTLAVAEGLRSETAARIAAAEQMSEACGTKLEALEQSWRLARQETITNELLEVVAGRQSAVATHQHR